MLVAENGEYTHAFEIRFEYHCSPFKEAAIIDNVIGVGHEARFYMLNLADNKLLCKLEVDGYFGHIYTNNGLFYVADASYLHCINTKGEAVWKSNPLGIDGVIVEDFDETFISGAGEWDPPDGWRDFKLDLVTGKIIS
ncbi:MAG: hypothetical protein M0D57_17570 [Sphingobacteriales bacterium JAD_PAG50586_3]|nr:MAG: hypothetical protein M0D57_17570 [Sphingobacteriales bacterium JAD_PAG50586_3]